MGKRYFKILIIGIIIAGGALFYFQKPSSNVSTTCKNAEMIFYFTDSCVWCQKVKDEETIIKIKELGVKVKEINSATGVVRHKFQGVPTFVINNKVYSGYKTFNELKELLDCPLDNVQGSEIQNQREITIKASKFKYDPSEIKIKKGEKIKLTINNTDTLHGIRIPELGIRGNDFIEFTAEKIGEFAWYCNNFCGQGHQQMQGKLIIE